MINPVSDKCTQQERKLDDVSFKTTSNTADDTRLFPTPP